MLNNLKKIDIVIQDYKLTFGKNFQEKTHQSFLKRMSHYNFVCTFDVGFSEFEYIKEYFHNLKKQVVFELVKTTRNASKIKKNTKFNEFK